jgi:isocitrate dehydrogenase (NAD+)
MSNKIAVLPGDGVGPEVVSAAVEILKAVDPTLSFTKFQVGYGRYKEKGASITDEVIEDVKKFDAILFGSVGAPIGFVENYRSTILELRSKLDLYANIRPAKSYLKDNGLDLIIFRENTEGLYSRKEHMRGHEAVAEKIVTEAGSMRIADLAFKWALNHGREKVTIVHKSNVLRLTDGLFSRICLEAAKPYPKIQVEEMYIDNACYQMVRNPARFDVILTMNLYGDILGDLAAGIGDGLGFAPSAQIGEKYSLFEPIHGTAPDIAGQNKANPIAAILSAKMMLDYLNKTRQAGVIQAAVEEVLSEGLVRPFDAGGTSNTNEITQAILARIKAKHAG